MLIILKLLLNYRFNTPDDHEKLVQSIIKEKKLQERLDELIAYRNKGFKNFSEIEVFY
jgi:hypothetical protein